MAEKLDSIDDKIRRIAMVESRLRGIRASLEPWETLDLKLETGGTATSTVTLGTFPSSVDLDEADRALSAVVSEAQVIRVSSDRELHYTVLVCLTEFQQEAMRVLRELGFSVAAFQGITGTAAENISDIDEKLTDMAADCAELQQLIADEALHRDALKLCADRMNTKIARAEAASEILYMERSFMVEGWIPEADEKKLAEVTEKYDCAWETSEPDPENPEEEVPIKLKSNTFTRPFNMITSMYSYPAYNGVDPNPFLFVSFAIFFGIMFADVGYGLIMILIGLFLKYKMKARGGMAWFSGLAMFCGISCVVFGALTGTFFGDIVSQVSAFFGGNAVFKGLIDPLKSPMEVLIISLVIGVIHMFVGVGIKGYMLIRDGYWVDALCDAGTVYLVFIGLGLGALGITWWVAIAGVVAIIATQGRESKSIGGKIGSGLYGLYNFATGWFGDILSYSRLMALMLASAVIAQVFNTLGAMTGSVIAFFIIFLIGHTLNFGLSIISAYVHSSRLEYLEFFSKFYREGGREFSPLTIETNYYVCNN